MRFLILTLAVSALGLTAAALASDTSIGGRARLTAAGNADRACVESSATTTDAKPVTSGLLHRANLADRPHISVTRRLDRRDTSLGVDASTGIAGSSAILGASSGFRQFAAHRDGQTSSSESQTVFVAVLVNLTRNCSRSAEASPGTEAKPVKVPALSLGYANRSLAAGLAIFGLDFAFVRQAPVGVSKTIRF